MSFLFCYGAEAALELPNLLQSLLLSMCWDDSHMAPCFVFHLRLYSVEIQNVTIALSIMIGNDLEISSCIGGQKIPEPLALKSKTKPEEAN